MGICDILINLLGILSMNMSYERKYYYGRIMTAKRKIFLLMASFLTIMPMVLFICPPPDYTVPVIFTLMSIRPLYQVLHKVSE